MTRFLRSAIELESSLYRFDLDNGNKRSRNLLSQAKDKGMKGMGADFRLGWSKLNVWSGQRSSYNQTSTSCNDEGMPPL
jgi:hypothetical protein